MYQAQFPGMQTQTGVFGDSVTQIARHRAPDTGPMDADLVFSPRFQFDLKQRAPAAAIQHLVVRHGPLGVGVAHYSDEKSLVFVERLVYDAGILRRYAVGYRQVAETLLGIAPTDPPTLRERGIAATRQLAKRQLTWLRSLPVTARFDCLSPTLYAQVRAALERAQPVP